MVNRHILQIRPPHLSKSLTEDERKRHVVMLNADASAIDDTSLRIDLQVIYSPTLLRESESEGFSCWAAARCAEVTITACGGETVDYMHEEARCPLNVEYIEEETQGASLGGGGKLSAKGPEISAAYKGEDRQSHKQVVTLKESHFCTNKYDGQVRWTIDLPRAASHYRGFLEGDESFFVRFKWKTWPHRGHIKARPIDVEFFDYRRKPLGRWRRLLLQFNLHKRQYKPIEKKGICVHFSQRRGESARRIKSA